jgi:hypothetical protein
MRDERQLVVTGRTERSLQNDCFRWHRRSERRNRPML